MKINAKILKEMVNKNLIMENRLKRWLDTHFHTNGFATITSDRGDKEPEENEENFKELMQLARSSGYGFVKTRGGWEELHDEEPVEVSENSLMIPNVNIKRGEEEFDPSELFELCKTASKMYGQEAFLFGWGQHHGVRPESPGRPFAAVYGPDGGLLYGPFSAAEEGNALKAWSKLVKGSDRRRKFAFVEWKAALPPKNQFEAMGRAGSGEIFLAKSKE